MRFAALLASISLALTASALPSTLFVQDSILIQDSASALPEAGELLSVPLAFGDDELAVYEVALGEGEVDAAIFDDWKNQVVSQHNTYRRKYGAPELTWSDALYSGTEQWAKQCKFQHSNGQGKYGENLAAGTGNAYGFSNGLKSWMDEASKYDYNHPGFSSATGHFTQVVWKGSKQVACAIANCGPGTIFGQASKYVVCRYSPAGNIIGHFPENVGRPR